MKRAYFIMPYGILFYYFIMEYFKRQIFSYFRKREVTIYYKNCSNLVSDLENLNKLTQTNDLYLTIQTQISSLLLWSSISIKIIRPKIVQVT